VKFGADIQAVVERARGFAGGSEVAIGCGSVSSRENLGSAFARLFAGLLRIGSNFA